MHTFSETKFHTYSNLSRTKNRSGEKQVKAPSYKHKVTGRKGNI